MRIEGVQRRFIKFALRRMYWRSPQRLTSYERRCRLIQLETLQRRRELAKALLVADLLTARVDCPALLQKLGILIRVRSSRNDTLLHVPFRRTNYSANTAIIGLQRAFNKVSTCFDFDVSRGTLKRLFRASLLTHFSEII